MLKHIVIWLVITTISLVLSPLIFDADQFKKKYSEDRTALANSIGEESASYIFNKTEEIYRGLFVESGFQPWFFKTYQIGEREPVTGLEEPDQQDKFRDYADTYVITFFISMYEMIYRLTQLTYWAAFSLPFVIAAAFDGLMQRKIRILTFKYSSPVTYNTMWHFLIALTSGTVIYCNTPFAMPVIAYPFLVFLFAMALRTLISNLQRSA